MALSNIDQKTVGQAYEDLKGEGLNPSLNRIRERLGTGSKGTIQSHLKAYLAGVAEQEEQKKIELPDSVVSVLKTVLTNTADSAKEKMAEQYRSIAQLLDESDKLRNDLEIRVNDLENHLFEKEESHTLALKSCDQAAAACNQKIVDLISLKKELEQKLEISVQGSETSRTALAKAEMQIERADKAVDVAEKALDSSEVANKKLVNQLSEGDKELSTLRAVLKEKDKAITRLETDLKASQLQGTGYIKEIKAETLIARKSEKEASTQSAIAKEQAKAISRLEADLKAMKLERDSALSVKAKAKVKA